MNSASGRHAVASTAQIKGAGDRARICVGAVTGMHGLHGAVRIKCFTADPENIAEYGPVSDEAGGRTFEIRPVSIKKDVMVARLTGVDDIEAAGRLKGTRLYVPRSVLPVPESDEFYHADLLGLMAVNTNGQALGMVAGIMTAGETDILEIEPVSGSGTALIPFNRTAVCEVDLENSRLVVEQPFSDLEEGASRESC